MENLGIESKNMRTKSPFLCKQEIVIIGLLAIIGLISGGTLSISQLALMTEEMKEEILSVLGSETMFIVVAAIQVFVLTIITSSIGIKISKKVGLRLYSKLNGRSVIYSLVIGGASALMIVGSDKFIFAPYLPEGTVTFTFSLNYFLASILYGGIIEEVLLRLFMMSLIVFLIAKITRTPSESLTGKKGIYVTAIVLAAVLFALGHLPATIQLLGVSVPIILRMFLLNGLAGIGFGYLYWKKGLNYAMLAHMMTHVFVQLVFMPLLF